MANASAKRIASQNEQAIRNLKLGMALSFVLSILFRLVLRRSSILPPSIGLAFLMLGTGLPCAGIFNYLVSAGAPKRHPSTGELLSPGEDLSRPGVIEWGFDVVYITWACHIGSAILGERVWWLYAIIPLYAFYKIWSNFISPMFFGGRGSSTEEETNENEGESKRQQKLRKRAERGDQRVRSTTKH